MLRILLGTLCLVVFTIPAMAQDDFPRVQMGMGYANLGLPGGDGTTSHHSGFAMQTGLNLVRWFGIENYTGFYGLGNGTTLISNIVSGKLIGRKCCGRTIRSLRHRRIRHRLCDSAWLLRVGQHGNDASWPGRGRSTKRVDGHSI